MRHGPAGSALAERWPDDALRPLTPQGRAKVRAVVAGLERRGANPERIVSSPMVRAVQTADIAADTWPRAARATWDILAPTEDPAVAAGKLTKLARRCRSVLVVGHEPHLSALAAMLAGGKRMRIRLRKAGVAVLRVTNRAGELQALLEPDDLAAISRRRRRA
jgi:phosphohistidine phosphatase